MGIPNKAASAIIETKAAVQACSTPEERWEVIWAVLKTAMAEGIKAGDVECLHYFLDGFGDLPGGIEGFEEAEARVQAWWEAQLRERENQGPDSLAA